MLCILYGASLGLGQGMVVTAGLLESLIETAIITAIALRYTPK